MRNPTQINLLLLELVDGCTVPLLPEEGSIVMGKSVVILPQAQKEKVEHAIRT